MMGVIAISQYAMGSVRKKKGLDPGINKGALFGFKGIA